MRPDVKIKDYYLAFIANANRDIQIYKEELEYYTTLKEKQIIYINANKEKYERYFKIYIEDEIVAIKRANLLIKDEGDLNRRFLLSQICKLGVTKSRIIQYEKMINLAAKRRSIKFRDYETYIAKYYNQVHKFLLQGFGYKFNYGIGTLCICRWKTEGGKIKIDYNATRLNKQALLAQGKKLWDKEEAKWYEERGLPYDGIDYRIYTKCSHVYQIALVKSQICKNNNHKFEHTEYISSKLRGLNYKQMAELCETLDDIVSLPIDLKYKLNIYLHKDPSNYVLYIRNDEQDRCKYGAHSG